MTGAYLLESEFKIYSKADRDSALEKILDKLGVAGSVNSKLKCSNCSKMCQYTYVFDSALRRLKNLDSDVFPNINGYFKYLILTLSDGKVTLLYNAKISRTESDYSIFAEGLFKINDIWEATRIVECSLIDIELEDILKSMYFKMATQD